MQRTAGSITEAIELLGIMGKSVCLHSSFKAIRGAVEGPYAVIDAFVACGCTLMVPTFSYGFMVSPPLHLRPRQNGIEYPANEEGAPELGEIYDPRSNAISSKDMGAIPTALLQQESRVRGIHPICSFSAVGPKAAKLIGCQTGSDVFAPFRALVEEGGVFVLAGVGLTRLTAIHYAEELAGRRSFVRWARGADGEVQAFVLGGCSNGFEKLDPATRHLSREVVLGNGILRAYPGREMLLATSDLIAADPQITHCGEETCLRCNDAVRGGRMGEG